MGVRFIRSLLLAVGVLFVSTASFGQIGISVTIAPPVLPVYEQPICPGDGYIWTPGYWAWGDGDYFWVPGTWVLAPEPGFLWTPGYWGWGGSAFIFNEGYWGPSVGFYGGINYGFGYSGHGYEGGRWDNGHFFYNTSVNNVNVSVIHNVYNTRVNSVAVSRVSFNGGNGGIAVRATAQEDLAAHARHVPAVAAQTQQAQAARSAPQQRFAANHGAPPVAATAKPGAFTDRAVAPARAAAANNAAPRPTPPVHAKDLTPLTATPPNTGSPKLDQKYQQQQTALAAKQSQDRQKLQQQQDAQHQQMAQQKAAPAKTQQVEQQHQQQTQQLQQKQTQQVQQMQKKQQPAAGRRGGGKPR